MIFGWYVAAARSTTEPRLTDVTGILAGFSRGIERGTWRAPTSKDTRVSMYVSARRCLSLDFVSQSHSRPARIYELFHFSGEEGRRTGHARLSVWPRETSLEWVKWNGFVASLLNGIYIARTISNVSCGAPKEVLSFQCETYIYIYISYVLLLLVLFVFDCRAVVLWTNIQFFFIIF